MRAADLHSENAARLYRVISRTHLNIWCVPPFKVPRSAASDEAINRCRKCDKNEVSLSEQDRNKTEGTGWAVLCSQSRISRRYAAIWTTPSVQYRRACKCTPTRWPCWELKAECRRREGSHYCSGSGDAFLIAFNYIQVIICMSAYGLRCPWLSALF